MTYELIITNIFRFLCLTCFSFIKNMILNPKLKQSFYGQRFVVFCNLEGGWGWWRCRGLWARRKHWDGIVWQPDRLSVSTEIIGSQDPPFGSACFYTDGSELMKKERHDVVLTSLTKYISLPDPAVCRRMNHVVYNWKYRDMLDFTDCSTARAAAIHSSSDWDPQSHLLHIHKHVRGTHATRLWGCGKHQILSARACHQRISPLDDIMPLLLAHHAPSGPPPLFWATQHASIPRSHIICCFFPLSLSLSLDFMSLLYNISSWAGNAGSPPAGTIPEKRLGRRKSEHVVHASF